MLCFCAALCLVFAAALGDISSQCDNLPPATVTFVVTCKIIDVTNAACWTPALPTAKDTVHFPANTNAVMEFAYQYTPLSVTNIVVSPTATVVLAGAAFEASNCILVSGALMVNASKVDDGAATTHHFAADPTVPMKTDCPSVPQGFTPRVCGPGPLVVTGTLGVIGLYASVFSPTYLRKGSVAPVGSGAFLWGNITNEAGTVDGFGTVYMHGFFYNYAAATFDSLRFDVWAVAYEQRPHIILWNSGTLQFASSGSHFQWVDYISTDISDYSHQGTNPTYRMKLINSGNVSFIRTGDDATTFGGEGFDMINSGMIDWSAAYRSSNLFTGTGVFVNMGTLIADAFSVHLSDYLSEGGILVMKNGGQFFMGPKADEERAATCKKKQQPPRKQPHNIGMREDYPRGTNASCDPTKYNTCAYPLCCGATGVCETIRCSNYGTPFCCFHNVGCAGCSFGAYCGGGKLMWEVDTECMDAVDFVDRYEFDIMKRYHPEHLLPKFGKHRFTFRGRSIIDGDGTGSLVIAEPAELRLGSELLIQRHGVIRAVVDSGAAPLQGTGTLLINGTFVAGIKASYPANGISVGVLDGGKFVIGRAGHVYLHSAMPFTMDRGAELRVDGKLVIIHHSDKEYQMKLCGSITGEGVVISDADKQKVFCQ